MANPTLQTRARWWCFRQVSRIATGTAAPRPRFTWRSTRLYRRLTNRSRGRSKCLADFDLPRSWLFAPGHDEKLLGKVFDVGADAVLLDLEDAVPAALKDRARGMVAEVAASKRCWVRVNRAQT